MESSINYPHFLSQLESSFYGHKCGFEPPADHLFSLRKDDENSSFLPFEIVPEISDSTSFPQQGQTSTGWFSGAINTLTSVAKNIFQSTQPTPALMVRMIFEESPKTNYLANTIQPLDPERLEKINKDLEILIHDVNHLAAFLSRSPEAATKLLKIIRLVKAEYHLIEDFKERSHTSPILNRLAKADARTSEDVTKVLKSEEASIGYEKDLYLRLIKRYRLLSKAQVALLTTSSKLCAAVASVSKEKFLGEFEIQGKCLEKLISSQNDLESVQIERAVLRSNKRDALLTQLYNFNYKIRMGIAYLPLCELKLWKFTVKDLQDARLMDVIMETIVYMDRSDQDQILDKLFSLPLEMAFIEKLISPSKAANLKEKCMSLILNQSSFKRLSERDKLTFLMKYSMYTVLNPEIVQLLTSIYNKIFSENPYDQRLISNLPASQRKQYIRSNEYEVVKEKSHLLGALKDITQKYQLGKFALPPHLDCLTMPANVKFETGPQLVEDLVKPGTYSVCGVLNLCLHSPVLFRWFMFSPISGKEDSLANRIVSKPETLVDFSKFGIEEGHLQLINRKNELFSKISFDYYIKFINILNFLQFTKGMLDSLQFPKSMFDSFNGVNVCETVENVNDDYLVFLGTEHGHYYLALRGEDIQGKLYSQLLFKKDSIQFEKILHYLESLRFAIGATEGTDLPLNLRVAVERAKNICALCRDLAMVYPDALSLKDQYSDIFSKRL